MKNKEIQEQRMKSYFVQATKELLLAEGLKSLSVRNIADKAGYSYATLYNYFKDVKELIFHCVQDFQEECQNFVEKKTKNQAKGKDGLIASIKAYIGYFLEYPSIFELFFLERIGDFGTKKETLKIIETSLERCLEKHLSFLSKEKAENLNVQLRFMVTGILLFYLNRHTPEDFLTFTKLYENQIETIVQTFVKED